MNKINLKNVIPLGVLSDGIYPNTSNSILGSDNEFTDDNELDVESAIFLYYRKSDNSAINGHLFLYKSKEKIEIDLTTLSGYDNTALFKLSTKENISDLNITDFESRNLNNGSYLYSTKWIKNTEQYIHFLVPINRCVVSTFLNNINVNSIFSLNGIYEYDNKLWWIYTTNFINKFDFYDDSNKTLNLKVYIRDLIPEDLNPIEQLSNSIYYHINNFNNPHEINKKTIGLSNVENTSDADKPLSILQKAYIDDKNKSIIPHIDSINSRLEQYNIKFDVLNNDILNQSLKLNNKQNIFDNALETEEKTIIGAINELLDLINLPKEYISSNTIKRIELVSDIPENYEDNVLYVRIPYYEEDYVQITIHSQPEEADVILINSQGERIESKGSATIRCLKGTKIQYIVSCEDYETKHVVLEVSNDITINVVLSVAPKLFHVKYALMSDITQEAYVALSKIDSDRYEYRTTVKVYKGSGCIVDLYAPIGYYSLTITPSNSDYKSISTTINITKDSLIPGAFNDFEKYDSVNGANIILQSPKGESIDGVIYQIKPNGNIYLGYTKSNKPLTITSGKVTVLSVQIISDKYKTIDNYKLQLGNPYVDNIITLEPEDPVTEADYTIDEMEIGGNDETTAAFTIF